MALHNKRKPKERGMLAEIRQGSERRELGDFISDSSSDIDELVIIWTDNKGVIKWKAGEGTVTTSALAMIEVFKFDILADWLCGDCEQKDED